MPKQGLRSPSSWRTRRPLRSLLRRSRRARSRAPVASGMTFSTVRCELEQTLDGDGYAAARRWTWHAGLPMRLSPSRVTLALLLGRSDRHDESRALWKELTAEAAERADPDVVRCLFHRAQTEMTSGAWDTAAQLCDEAIELTRQIGLEMFEPLCLSILAEIDAYRGETESARGAIPELLRVVETGRFRWARLSPADRTRGPRALLRTIAAASWRQAAPLLHDVEELDGYLAQLAGSAGIEALLAIGDLRRAERLLTLIDRRAADGDIALRPLVLRCRGLLLASQGDRERAIASLEAASPGAGAASGSEPLRARADAARARNRAAPGAAQARRSRVARTGRRDLRAARRAPLGGEGATRSSGGSAGARHRTASSRRPSGGSSSSSSPDAGTARSPPSSA